MSGPVFPADFVSAAAAAFLEEAAGEIGLAADDPAVAAAKQRQQGFMDLYADMVPSAGCCGSEPDCENYKCIWCPRTSIAQSRSGRRPSTETLFIRSAIKKLTGRYDRMTVRQVFYALEVAGFVEKTEGGYRQVQGQVLLMRRAGWLPWDFITDGTRWQRKPRSSDSATDFLDSATRSYRRDLWQSQDVRVEVWLEKDALADVVIDATNAWDVALMVSRGQSSATFLHSAAQAAIDAWEQDVATIIYTLYDHDAGGERSHKAIATQLPEFAPGVPITVHRLAVTPAQIIAWNLPTRPPKAKDPQAKAWGDKPNVELDAIPPNTLVDLVEEAIVSHVDAYEWEVEQAVEAEERKGLLALADAYRNGTDR
jgi:hypothetical protein